jgi:hypothetical protein
VRLAGGSRAAAGIYAIALAIWEPGALTLPVAVHRCDRLVVSRCRDRGVAAAAREPDGNVDDADRRRLVRARLRLVGRFRLTHLSDLSQNVFLALIAHQVIVFPHGVARSRLERVLVGTAYGLALGGYLLSELVEAANDVLSVVAIAVLVGIVFVVVERWRTASVPERRALAPVLRAGPPVLVVAALSTISMSRYRRRAIPRSTGPSSSIPRSRSRSSPGSCESSFSVSASESSSSSSAAGLRRLRAFVRRSPVRSGIRRSRSHSGFPAPGDMSTPTGGGSSPETTACAP